MKKNMRRPGSVMAVAMAGLMVTGLLGMALMNRSVASARSGRWSRDHLALRALADRTFKVGRVTPPRPLDQVGLCVGLCDRATVPGARAGSSAFAVVGETPRTLVELFTMGGKLGLKGLPQSTHRAIGQALGSL